MDNKEAIEILNITCGKRLYVTDNKEEERKLVQAFNMAIAALRDSQPDWRQAPDWADWYAIDADGQCFWYENEPVKRGNNFFPSSGVEKLHYQKRTQTLFKRPE